MAASAAKAVWGENKATTQEPVSGRLGDTSKGEPYDAGNIGMINSPAIPSRLRRDVIHRLDHDEKPLLIPTLQSP